MDAGDAYALHKQHAEWAEDQVERPIGSVDEFSGDHYEDVDDDSANEARPVVSIQTGEVEQVGQN